MACAAASARQYGMDIRGKILSWKLYRESLLSRPYGHTVWGNVRPDGSQKPLSATSTPSFGHLVAYRPSYGISNTTCLGACLRACNTRLLVCHHKKRKNRQKKHRKNRPGLLLRRLLSFHCPFTDQRCLDIWFYNGPFFGKLQPLAPLWGDWALPFAKLCPHHCTGWSEATPVESTCCSRVRRSFDYGVCVADCYRDLTQTTNACHDLLLTFAADDFVVSGELSATNCRQLVVRVREEARKCLRPCKVG